MTIDTVNVLSCELDESLNEAEFAHRAASIADRLGARRIHASVYEAFADRPIWPYHYHYSTEEWLYVISGAPVLRDAGGRRTLRSGDLVGFASDHRGAHTLFGPGRFIIFSTNESPGPWVSVYPDSDKISISPGLLEPTELNALILPRSSQRHYWSGEGSADPPAPPLPPREPSDTPHLPLLNAVTVAMRDPGSDATGVDAARMAPLEPTGAQAGLTATVVELDPGVGAAPYHYIYGREQWILVLSGSATLQHPGGEDRLQAGDVVCCAEGPAGARRLRNEGRAPMRALLLATTGVPASVCYPDSGTWILRTGPDEPDLTLSSPNSGGEARRWPI